MSKKATLQNVQEQHSPIRLAHILAATDFSVPAAAALAYGKLIARAFAARITVLHADPILAHAASGSRQYETTRKIVDLFATEQLREFPDTRWSLTGERPLDAILRESRTGNADLLVMGTTSRTALRRAVLGSVTENVIRESDRPVLTARLADQRGPKITRILCPVNYTPVAAHALEYAVTIAGRLNAELVILNLIEDEAWHGMEIETGLMKRWVGEIPTSVKTRFLVQRGNPFERVTSFVDWEGIDLLVIGAQQRRMSTGTVIGSTTEKLVRHASCAVLTVPQAISVAPDERSAA